MFRKAGYLLMVALLPVLTSLSAPGCAPYEDEPAAANANSEKVKNLPPLEEPDKGNPKLSSALNQLVSANEKGEAEAFARSSGIELLDGSVTVTIESVPGQIEAAAQAARDAGAWLGASYKNWLDAVVPITSITALAEAESIRFIRLPDKPVPEE